ncbi:MAG: hypothetical protein U9Q70_09840, partial [Chloroflexota bacterium]|nr:hypothetical protein [Chloroflexota bacterium]
MGGNDVVKGLRFAKKKRNWLRSRSEDTGPSQICGALVGRRWHGEGTTSLTPWAHLGGRAALRSVEWPPSALTG